MSSFVSRRRAIIAVPVTVAFVVAGVGLAVSPAWADSSVSDYSALSAAFAAGDPTPSTVTLSADITSNQDLPVPGSAVLVLDLAGYDLTLRQLSLGADSTLTITDSGSSDPGVLLVGSAFYNEGGIRTTGATLTIDGQVVVDATGGDSVAGIGGADGESGGTVTIAGTADVTAQGGANAAGIGGGKNGGGGAPTIEGSATVDATGGTSGAGIGGGLNTGAGAPTIQGDATVTAQGGSGAAGIGGGGYSTLGGGTGGGAILITDTSDVTANGGAGGTGIGAVGTGGLNSIFVSGSATVSAHGFGAAVGIGAGYGIGGTVRFTDSSTTTAVGGSTAWGVGTGTMANPAEVDVEDSATLTTSGGLGSIGGVDDAFNDVVVDGELVIPVGKTLTVPNAGDSVSGDGILSGGGTVVNHGIISLPDANVTVANVTLHNYDVTFDGAGGVLTPTGPLRLLASSMNSGVRSFPTGARSGFLLTGWKAGATDFNGYSTVTADVTLTAQWGSYAATLPTPLITGQAKVGHDLLADPVAAN